MVDLCKPDGINRAPPCLNLCKPAFLACRDTEGTVKVYAFEQFPIGQRERNGGFGVEIEPAWQLAYGLLSVVVDCCR